jgi:hypothetical protein
MELNETPAYPDFLLRGAGNDHVSGSPWREPHVDHQSHGSPQEIRGTRISYFAVLVTTT